MSKIDDSDRIRTSYTHVTELAESIEASGQLQPIVLTADYKLVAGGSRLRAVRDVLKRTHIHAVFVETLSEDRLRLLEVEENVKRKSFTWQETTLGILRVHELHVTRVALNPEPGVALWTATMTGRLLGRNATTVSYALRIGKLLRGGDKDLAACASFTDAIKLLMDRQEKEATKLLAKMTMVPQAQPTQPTAPAPKAPTAVSTSSSIDDLFSPALGVSSALAAPLTLSASLPEDLPPDFDAAFAPSTPASEAGRQAVAEREVRLANMLFLGDCIGHMQARPESVDHIITDIPYGIEMDNLDQEGTGMDVTSTAAEHDVVQNLILMERLFPAAYSMLRPNGFFCLWYDIQHHEFLVNLATSAGFSVQRWPLVWMKLHACLNQQATVNFTKRTEVCLVLRKGSPKLVSQQPSNYFACSLEDTKQRFQHPFAKPVKLWRWLLDAVAIRGQIVYDPFAGCGSSTIAALEAGLLPLASELNEDHYNSLVLNVSEFIRKQDPSVKFV